MSSPREPNSAAPLSFRDLHVATKASISRFLRENLSRERSFTLAAVDLRAILCRRRDPGVRAWKSLAQVVVPYGVGMTRLVRHGDRRVPPAADAFHRPLFHWARELGRRVFFITPDGLTAHDTAQRAARRFPGLKIAGADALAPWVRGPRGIAGLAEALRLARADVVIAWVSSGPDAERLLELRRSCAAAGFLMVMGGLPALLSDRPAWEPRAAKRIRRRTEPSTVVSIGRAARGVAPGAVR